ncbi:MAG TPA: zinc-binding dehydrogenase [Bacteroidales bacterium]|nr:zinc-binding dehydrogenase [Bacteroidales bacterium]
MKTKAVRIYGKNDLRLEEFDLPPIKDDEILAHVICDSLCMSSYKATKQGADHKRIPDDVHLNPTIIGHEFSGIILEAGKKWESRYIPGMKFSIQPALNYPGGPVGILSAPGYSYRYIGGDATHVIIPNEVMENNCLLPYSGKGFYPAALAEPLSCVIGAIHANYHTKPGSYVHQMEIAEGGNMALLAGAGPMGLAAINYVVNRRDRNPGLLVVTDIDDQRLRRASELFQTKTIEGKGIKLVYINTATISDPVKELRKLTGDKGFDDVFVFAPVPSVIEQGDSILAFDGCLNFFAGPSDPGFRAPFNFYNVHYSFTHIVGTSGGNNTDMLEALQMMSEGLDPAGLVTHIGGLDAVIETTKHLPEIPGGKKLMYTNISLPLTAIADFAEKGRTNPLFASLAEITAKNNGLWSTEAEEVLLTMSR